MKSRDGLRRAACKGRSTLLMCSYKQVRNKVNRLNIKLERENFTVKVHKFEGNMKETWKTINKLLQKRSKATNIEPKDPNNNTISDMVEISQAIKSFFCSIGKDLASHIEDAPNPLLSGDYVLRTNEATFIFKSIQVYEIKEAIGRIKSSRSFGNDGISNHFLKLAMPLLKILLSTYLTHQLKQVCFQTPGKCSGNTKAL